jgi:predicted membrane channel-forming protein YqfA (hemolysin III family)
VALANRPPKNRQRLLSILLVIAMGAMGVIGYRIITSEDWAGNFVYFAAAVFMGGYVAYIFLRPYFAARKLWANPGTQRPLKGTINKLGITFVFQRERLRLSGKTFTGRKKPAIW